MTISQTMRVLHSSATGKFHIQGVQILTLQTYLKNNKASTNSVLMQCHILETMYPSLHIFNV